MSYNECPRTYTAWCSARSSVYIYALYAQAPGVLSQQT